MSQGSQGSQGAASEVDIGLEITTIDSEMSRIDRELYEYKERIERLREEKQQLIERKARLTGDVSLLDKNVLRTLSVDCLYEIFSFLPLFPDLMSVSYVCQAWNSVISKERPGMWRAWSFTSAKDRKMLRDQNFIRIAKIFNNLEDIDLAHCSNISDTALRQVLASSFPRLRSIDLRGTNMFAITAKQFLATHKHLTSFKISKTTDLVVQMIVSGNPNLKNLVLSQSEQITNKACTFIAESCLSLKSLTIDNAYKLSDPGIRALALVSAKPPSSPTVKNTKSGNKRSPKKAPAIENSISDTNNNNNSSNSSRSALLRNTKGSQLCLTLEELNISSSSTSDNCLEFLMHLRKLRALDVSRCRIRFTNYNVPVLEPLSNITQLDNVLSEPSTPKSGNANSSFSSGHGSDASQTPTPQPASGGDTASWFEMPTNEDNASTTPPKAPTPRARRAVPKTQPAKRKTAAEPSTSSAKPPATKRRKLSLKGKAVEAEATEEVDAHKEANNEDSEESNGSSDGESSSTDSSDDEANNTCRGGKRAPRVENKKKTPNKAKGKQSTSANTNKKAATPKRKGRAAANKDDSDSDSASEFSGASDNSSSDDGDRSANRRNARQRNNARNDDTAVVISDDQDSSDSSDADNNTVVTTRGQAASSASLNRLRTVTRATGPAERPFALLRSLNVSNSRFIVTESFQNILQLCPALEEIDISKTAIEMIDISSSTTTPLPPLRRITAVHMTKLASFNIEEALPTLRWVTLERCTPLTMLRLVHSTEDSLHYVSVTMCKKLETVEIVSEHLTSLALTYADKLTKATIECPLLSSLTIDGCKRFRSRSLIDVVEQCPSLRSISICMCNDIADEKEELIQAIGENYADITLVHETSW